MIPITFLNNYPMREAQERVAAGEYPGHHLWGYGSQSVEGDLDWRMPRWSIYEIALLRRPKLKWIRNAIVKLVGDPFQQAHTLLKAPRDGVVYAADQRSAGTLGALKTLGLWRRKMVVVIHHPPKNRWERWCLNAVDEALYLSPLVGDAIRRDLPGIRRVIAAPWGPDLSSPVYGTASTRADPGTLDFVAAGKTNRDYDGLHISAVCLKLSGIVFESGSVTRYIRGEKRVERRSANYLEIVQAMHATNCVVIPIADPNIMAGLTEVADAIAVNKPILVNRSRAFPYDVDATNSGAVLDDTTAGSISAGILRARGNQLGGAAELGKTYNLEEFARVLVDALHHSRV